MSLCLALVGPTASGKSAFALELAKALGGEIVCLDSTTVYKHFDIGSAKPGPEARAEVPHHLLDVMEPEAPFSAYDFVVRAEQAIAGIQARGRLPIVVGGTLFYLRALQHGMYPTQVVPAEIVEAIETEYVDDERLDTKRMHEDLAKVDPEMAGRVHPHDRYRLIRALALFRTTGEPPSRLKPEPLSEAQRTRVWMKYSLTVPRHRLSQQISIRSASLIEKGIVEETRRLRESYPKARALSSIGYAEAARFLDQKLTQKQLLNEIIEKTRQLAKRQLTWIRSDMEMRFVDRGDLGRIKLEVDNLSFVLSKGAA